VTLRLDLLGSPLVEVDGAPLAVDTRKAVALLAFLALEGGAHRRDTLAALLWPETEPDRARAALRRTLSTLRHGLGGGYVVVLGETVSLDPAGVLFDVARFRALAAEDDPAALAEAASLYRAELLSGFGLRDSVAFDDWQSLQAGRLARELGALLDRLAERLAARGDVREALEYARRRLQLDPLHEPAHYRLMDLAARAGERAVALEQYRECVRTLHRELGVGPLESTTELYHAIRDGRVATTPEPPPALAPLEARPLVGREREWGELIDSYRAVGPDGRVAVLEGELGIGKTRLAEELLAWARSEGAVGVGVRAFEHERDLAYGTVIELLRGGLRDGDAARVPETARAEAARLVPALGPAAPETLDGPGAQARFFDGLAVALESLTSGPAPALLVVDDAHWADAASLDALAYLARRLRGRPLLLVLTWRPEEAQSARRVLAEGRGTTVRLGRLGRDGVARMAAAAGAREDVVDRLFGETQGVPFFVAEYLDAGAEGWELPTGVRALLEARLAGASEVAAQVAAAAAVLGREFDPDTVRRVAGRADEEVVVALEELCGRGILAEGGDETYDFRHEQARRVAYEGVGVGRRRLLHGRAADALTAGPATAVAQHLRLAGRDEEAARWYASAGEQAQALHANAEALAHYEAALGLGHPDTVRLQRAVGDLQTLQGRYADALAGYESAAAFADEGERAELEHRIGLVHDRRGEFELADASFAEALALTADDELERRARLLADRSLAAHRLGRDADAAELAAASLGLAERAGDERAGAQAHNILGVLATRRGDAANARAELEQSLTLAEASDDVVARIAALNNLALVDGDVGRLEAARALAATIGDRHREAALANNLADLLHAAGRQEEAMAVLKEAVALFAEIGEDSAREPEIWKLRDW
jgi:DNA-binding SARP family transcriptional activator/Tfp pilus assembly protein PilF